MRRETRRWYPYGDLAAHVVGYLQEINAEELELRFAGGYRAGATWWGATGSCTRSSRRWRGGAAASLVVLDPVGQPIREII